ncbi:MAG: transketolase [Janthinobacterium sp.]|jgi:transketolase
MSNKQLTLKQLERTANTLRQDLIKMLLTAKSGHSAGPLGLADFFTAMYFKILNHDPKKPTWEGRDRLVMSCGHNVPIRYVAMASAGYFPKSDLKTLRKLGSKLQGHPSYIDMPAMENSSGPLGQGSSIAVGKALAAKLKKQKHYIYLLMSDGEQEEGQTWEAVMSAGKYKLNNLIAFIDRNNIQIDGYTEDVMPLENLRAKYEAFNWHVIEVDGHNIEQIIDAVEFAKAVYEKPTVVIMHTIPGKGVDFMEKDYTWHGKTPKPDEAKLALRELRTLRGKITGEFE